MESASWTAPLSFSRFACSSACRSGYRPLNLCCCDSTPGYADPVVRGRTPDGPSVSPALGREGGLNLGGGRAAGSPCCGWLLGLGIWPLRLSRRDSSYGASAEEIWGDACEEVGGFSPYCGNDGGRDKPPNLGGSDTGSCDELPEPDR